MKIIKRRDNRSTKSANPQRGRVRIMALIR
jgi:hypothetical protein